MSASVKAGAYIPSLNINRFSFFIKIVFSIIPDLSCKCNILLRDIPVFSSWLKDKENCYMGKNTNDFVSIIKKMISGEYPSLINNGYEVAKKKELSIIGKELCDVYNQVLNSN